MPIFDSEEIFMNIITFSVGDILEMKKNHPCGSKELKVMRVGSDVRVICCGCGRDMTVPRVKLEHSIKRVRKAEADEKNS